MKLKAPTGRDALSTFYLLAGCGIAAFGISVFLVPNRIAAGGVTGLATVIHHWMGWPVGLVSLGLNIPLFLVGFRLIGSGFGIRTLVATIVLSLAIDLFAAIPSPTDDLLLAALAGGAILGIGLGMVFRQDSTTGGTDLAARIIHKGIPFVSIAQVLLVIDILVVLTATISFESYELGLYAVASLILTTKTIDTVTLGINFTKAAHIITRKTDEVAKRIFEELDRGATGLDGRGLYTGDRKEVIVCVLTARQVPKLRRLVKDVDPDAFLYITEARDVFGEGFQAVD